MKFAFQTVKALVLTIWLIVRFLLLVAAILAVAFSPVIIVGLLISGEAAYWTFISEIILAILLLLSIIFYGDWEKYYEPGDIFAHERFVGWKFNKKDDPAVLFDHDTPPPPMKPATPTRHTQS